MKGINIVVKGDIGHMSAFMAQSGNLVVMGDAGDALGDSIYEARLFVRGEVKSLGADCIEKEMRPEHIDLIATLLDRPASTASNRASSSATALRANFTISTSITPTPTEAPTYDLPESADHAARSATFDDYTMSEIRRARRRAFTTSAAAGRNASCRISMTCCSSAPHLALSRSKATASAAAPTWCSAPASPRSRSS
jgi:hypothetical protein